MRIMQTTPILHPDYFVKRLPTSCSWTEFSSGGGPPLSIRPQPAPQVGGGCGGVDEDAGGPAGKISSSPVPELRVLKAISVPLLDLALRCLLQTRGFRSRDVSAMSSGEVMIPTRSLFRKWLILDLGYENPAGWPPTKGFQALSFGDPRLILPLHPEL